jgi:hypothetical protein
VRSSRAAKAMDPQRGACVVLAPTRRRTTMPDPRPLEQFRLEETEAGYLITIQAKGGEPMAVEASPEQIDAIIDALDDLLSDDDLDFDDDEAEG